MIRVASFLHELDWMVPSSWSMIELPKNRVNVFETREWLHKNCLGDVVIWLGNEMMTWQTAYLDSTIFEKMMAARATNICFYFADTNDAMLFKMVMS